MESVPDSADLRWCGNVCRSASAGIGGVRASVGLPLMSASRLRPVVSAARLYPLMSGGMGASV